MTDYLRVRDKDTGHEYTVPAKRVNEDLVEVLDKPALGIDGLPAPVKYRTPLGRPATGRRRTKKPVPTGDPPAENNDGQQADSAEEN